MLWYSALHESCCHHRFQAQSSITLYMTFAALEQLALKHLILYFKHNYL